MNWIATGLAGAALAAAVLPAALPPVQETAGTAQAWMVQAAEPAAARRTLHFAQGTASVTETVQKGVSVRICALPNGDTVKMARLTAPAGEACVEEVRLEGGGTLRWYDAQAGQWQSQPLRAGTVRTGCAVITMESGGELFLYTPKVYESLERATVRHLPALDGSIELRQDGGGWTLRVLLPSLPAGCEADYLLLTGREALFDWSDEAAVYAAWSAHDTLDDTGKWRYDGYYYRSPDTYVPAGADCYYRQPSAYLIEHYLNQAADCRAAWDLAAACLDVMARQQNVYGYFPTQPESQWLAEDYGIGPGFYDTRFNSDLAENFYRFGQLGRCREFDAVMDRYFDFYLTFAADHHQETRNGGWLVDDYGDPAGAGALHTSLNHQLSEILTLYRFSEVLARPELSALAERMLQAVEDTETAWIAPGGDLHYAVFADGRYGNADYPYLTYNDLFKLRQYLASQGRTVPAVQRLMDAKRAWMDAHGVTEYLR